jgi:adenine-specific DNA methylase
MPTYRKKLIEVALPLEAINVASAREKSIRHGHPSTLHLWWARRPLAACRAVLFSSLVDDPGEPAAPAEYLALIDRLPVPTADKPNWPKLSTEERRRRSAATEAQGRVSTPTPSSSWRPTPYDWMTRRPPSGTTWRGLPSRWMLRGKRPS